jgi:hypothetical protein
MSFSEQWFCQTRNKWIPQHNINNICLYFSPLTSLSKVQEHMINTSITIKSDPVTFPQNKFTVGQRVMAPLTVGLLPLLLVLAKPSERIDGR